MAGIGERPDGTAAAAHGGSVARMRRAGGVAARSGRTVRRAAAGGLPSRNRFGRTHAAGFATGGGHGFTVGGALRRAAARFGQSAHADGHPAQTHRA